MLMLHCRKLGLRFGWLNLYGGIPRTEFDSGMDVFLIAEHIIGNALFT